MPLKEVDSAALERLAAALARAEAFAKGRDAPADDAVPAPFGKVDPVDWSIEAVRALVAKRRGGEQAPSSSTLPNARRVAITFTLSKRSRSCSEADRITSHFRLVEL